MAELVDIKRRAEHSFVRYNKMRELYRDAYRLGAPNREGYESTEGVQEEGEYKQRFVYDSTFQDAVDRLANAYYIGMFPPSQRWFDFKPGSLTQEDRIEELQEMLQFPTKTTFDSIKSTNFYTQIHPMLIDFIFGTGAMQIAEGDTGDDMDVIYTAIPTFQLGIEEGKYGNVDATYRKHKITARNIKVEFPQAKIPDDLQKVINDSPDSQVRLLTATIPEVRGDRRFVQYIVWEEGKGAMLEERPFFENPIVVPRYSVLAGEIYGRGPAIKAAATAYSLNEAAKLVLMAANVGIFGMWTITDDGINPDTFKMGPGALLPVESNAKDNPSIQQLPSVAQMDFGQFSLDYLQSQVKRGMMVDQLGNVEGSKATAFEISERVKLVMQDMGAAYGRLNSEFTQPMINRHAAILGRRGKILPIKVDGQLVTLEYTSPLARAQSAEELTSMRALREEAQAHGTTDPSANARLKNGDMLKRQAALTGIDMDFIRDDDEVQMIMNKIAEADQAMQETAEGA
jgi:hypothetical protein